MPKERSVSTAKRLLSLPHLSTASGRVRRKRGHRSTLHSLGRFWHARAAGQRGHGQAPSQRPDATSLDHRSRERCYLSIPWCRRVNQFLCLSQQAHIFAPASSSQSTTPHGGTDLRILKPSPLGRRPLTPRPSPKRARARSVCSSSTARSTARRPSAIPNRRLSLPTFLVACSRSMNHLLGARDSPAFNQWPQKRGTR